MAVPMSRPFSSQKTQICKPSAKPYCMYALIYKAIYSKVNKSRLISECAQGRHVSLRTCSRLT